MFSCEFCELFKNTCFVEDLQRAGFETPGRSSRPEVFCEKGVLRNFGKFTGKHLCQSLFFNKFAGGRLFLRDTFFYGTPLVAASNRSGGVSSIKLQA